MEKKLKDAPGNEVFKFATAPQMEKPRHAPRTLKKFAAPSTSTENQTVPDTAPTADAPETMHVTQYAVAMVRDSKAVKMARGPVDSMAKIVELVVDMKSLDREQLRAYFLDARHNLIGWEMVSQGTLTASLAHPREIFKGVLLANAAGFIIVHNHPSGDPSPSEEDCRLTKRLAQCAQIMGVDLLDHLIVAENGCYSFKTAGQL